MCGNVGSRQTYAIADNASRVLSLTLAPDRYEDQLVVASDQVGGEIVGID